MCNFVVLVLLQSVTACRTASTASRPTSSLAWLGAVDVGAQSNERGTVNLMNFSHRTGRAQIGTYIASTLRQPVNIDRTCSSTCHCNPTSNRIGTPLLFACPSTLFLALFL